MPADPRPPTIARPSGTAQEQPIDRGRPRIVLPDPAEPRFRLATFGLRDRDPDLTAMRTLSRRQRRVLVVAVIVLVGTAAFELRNIVIVAMAIVTVLYLSAILFRLRLYHLSAKASASPAASPEGDLLEGDDELPRYTVLVPVYHEPAVLPRLIANLQRIDYPMHLLDIKLLIEADDDETLASALGSPGIERFEIVMVPGVGPRTKPKALNYGLALATGELLTIYDAEDQPDPHQLRQAAHALARGDQRTACLQAELGYFNPDQNLVTRWFTIEYIMWFTQFLPGLSLLDAPLPLGGTSNHFRTETLRQVGGWDPFNVTEDADLGLRLHRAGYRTGVLKSRTLEEANSDFVNWVRQRSRWYKGYLQTLLVHLRHPRQIIDDIGARSFLRFLLFVGGTPLLALLNPIFWTMTIVWFIGHPAGIKEVFPAPVYYGAVVAWLLGNFAFFYMVLLVSLETDDLALVAASVLTPFYWVMMSIAAVKAAWQLATQPNYWEKTVHGLDDPDGGGVAPLRS